MNRLHSATTVAACLMCAVLITCVDGRDAYAQGPAFAPGNPLTRVTSTDIDLDNAPDIVQSSTFTYDKKNNPVLVVTTTDGNNLVDADGVVDQIQTITSTFDSKGNVTQDVIDSDVDPAANDGPETRTTDVYTYSSKGDLLERVTDFFSLPSNTHNSHQVTTSTYDKGILLTQHTEFDFVPLGSINRITDVTNVLDQQGRIIKNTLENDFDGNGTVDQRTVVTIDRQNNGLLELQTVELDGDVPPGPFADGLLDEVRTTTGTFHGHDIVQTITDVDVAPLGSVDRRDTTTFNYDQQGRSTGREISVDLGANGSEENTLDFVSTLDKKGNVLTSVSDIDQNQDGFEDSRITQVFTY